MDFIRHTQSRVRVTSDQELSWAIVAIGECLGTDISWTNSFDEELHFEDLVRYELDQKIEEAACGGTHSLFGLSWVYQLHRRNGGQEAGIWKEVTDKTAKYQELPHPSGHGGDIAARRGDSHMARPPRAHTYGAGAWAPGRRDRGHATQKPRIIVGC